MERRFDGAKRFKRPTNRLFEAKVYRYRVMVGHDQSKSEGNREMCSPEIKWHSIVRYGFDLIKEKLG
jgi:hypothetical protein